MAAIDWASGLYEGEGTCYLDNNGRYKLPTIAIQMTNKEALEKFKEAVEVGTIYGPIDKGPKYKLQFVYRCRKISDVLTLISKIYPSLTKERQDQIDKVMNVYYNGDWWF